MTDKLLEERFGIVGLGVIGASIAGALMCAGVKNVIGFDISLETQHIATANKWISEARPFNEQSFRDIDWLIVCLYPEDTKAFTEKYQHVLKSGSRISDVCGVKKSITDWMLANLRHDLVYISFHPMAGRESSGIHFADPSLFINANFIAIDDAALESDHRFAMASLSSLMGFNSIQWMTVDAHDAAITLLSQMPHVLAILLMTGEGVDASKNLVGSSFKDATRVANINEDLWCELMLGNREQLIEKIEAFEWRMKRFKKAVKEGDRSALTEVMLYAKNKRIGLI